MRLYIRQSPFSTRRRPITLMGTVEGQFVGWLEAEAVAKPEQDTHAQVASLVEEYSTTLYRVAYSVTRNAADAEDVVQETFLRVLRHHEKLTEVRDYRVWLVRIAWNLVLDRKRRAKTRPQTDDFEDVVRVLPASEISAEKRVITAQRHARILHLIDTLPAREREVLLLSAVQRTVNRRDRACAQDHRINHPLPAVSSASCARGPAGAGRKCAMTTHSEIDTQIDDTLRRLGSVEPPIRHGAAGQPPPAKSAPALFFAGYTICCGGRASRRGCPIGGHCWILDCAIW